jgi:tetratricopeptide (TPR) repeat protein
MKSKVKAKYPLIWLILGLALALRLWNIIAIGDGFYANFLSDASTYKLWASKILAGSSYLGPAFPMGPLYPYFLALCLSLGLGFGSVLFLQAVFGTAVVYIIYILSRGIFEEKAGLISAFMAAIYAPFIFYDGLLLSESLQLLLISLALFLIIPPKNKKVKTVSYLFGGLSIGLTALGRGTILIFVLFVVIYWLYQAARSAKSKGREYIKRAILVLVGSFCGILPAALHNVVNGEPVLISSNSGINFYIGNNPEAAGAYDEPRGLNLSSDFTGRGIAERETGRQLKSSQVSGYWSGKAFDFLKDHPLSFLRGLLVKAWLYLWYFDIPQAEAVQIQGEFSPAFKIFPSGYWFVLIPGLWGMFLSKRGESERLLILLFLSALAGAVIFFVIGRFKLAGSISLLVFSGGGMQLIYHSLRDGNSKIILKGVIILAISFLVLFLPRPLDRKAKIASAYDNVGISLFYKNKPGKAVEWYRKALEIKPTHAGALNNLGGYFYTEMNPDSAIYYFRLSINSDSTDDKPCLNLGRTFLNKGFPDSAYYYYQKAKSLAPYGMDADRALAELAYAAAGDSTESPGIESFDRLLGLAEAYAAQRRFELAETYYKKALELNPDDIRALNNLGFAYQAQGKFGPAGEIFARLIELSGGSAIAYNNLAGVVYRQGLIDSAEVLWEKAVRLDPGNSQIRKNLEFLQKEKNN